jgi:hypothetical protein
MQATTLSLRIALIKSKDFYHPCIRRKKITKGRCLQTIGVSLTRPRIYEPIQSMIRLVLIKSQNIFSESI